MGLFSGKPNAPSFIVLAATLSLGVLPSVHASAVLDDMDWDEQQDAEAPAKAAPVASKKTVQPVRKPETVRRTRTYFGMGYERRMQTLGAGGAAHRRGGRGGRGR